MNKMQTVKESIWYHSAADKWTQTLPMGNGHMGAMAYGGAEGRFDLSENTCWSGSPKENCLVDNAKDYMDRARELLTQNKIDEAEKLIEKCCGIKGNYGTQVPMGRLFAGVNEVPVKTYRELDLITGVCMDRLYYDGCEVKRESFISNPHKVMSVRLSTDAEKLPQLRVWLEGWSQPSHTEWQGEDLAVRGRALENIHSDGLHGVQYDIRLRINTDGIVSWSRKGMIIDDATSLTLYMAAVTDMFCENMETHCLQILKNAVNMSWDKLYAMHTDEHSGWMNNCTLTLPGNDKSHLPTDQRIKEYGKDKSDQALVSLFFQFGRYLLLNSSRPDSLLPAALQGIWNDDRACRMQWTDDMHLDINTQMNYYPAEVTGLSECTLPLFDWLNNKLCPNGKRMAKDLYGSEGWVAHTVSNAYGWAAPGWDYEWGFHVSGGAWVATHIWQHFLFSRDINFLRDYFDVLYGAGKFLRAILTEDPETGEWVTNPSYSPENAFTINDKIHRITTGATIDTIVAKYIFHALIEGAAILKQEDEFIQGLKDIITKLPEFKVGKYGQLMEWNKDYKEALPDHRHTSHLLAMHPFNLIAPESSPELKAAIRTTLDRRLGENARDIILANWSGALLILYNARLLDGEAAGEYLKPMITFLSRENMMITHEGPTTSITGGIFELDGNTGLTAGIAEMLLQSYHSEIHILPAIPKEWTHGQYTGLVAEGGHKVDVKWDSNLVQVTIYAKNDDRILVRYGQDKSSIEVMKDQKTQIHFLGCAPRKHHGS